MLHINMTLSRLMVYAQLIKVIAIKLKRSCATYQVKLRSKKRVQTQDGPSAPKGNLRKEVVLKMENLHVLLVEKVTIANVYWVLGVASVFVNMIIR